MTPNDVAICIIAICGVSAVAIISGCALEAVRAWARREPPRQAELQALQDGQSELFARLDAQRGNSFAPLGKVNELREEISELRHSTLKRLDELDSNIDKNARATVRTVEEFKALQIAWVEEKNKLAGLMAPRR